jgi:G8 domain
VHHTKFKKKESVFVVFESNLFENMKILFKYASLIFVLYARKVLSAALRHKSEGSSRNLQVDGMKDFAPLTCNANIGITSCRRWTSLFGAATSFSERVIVPCGQCVTMDVEGETLDLLGGLDVIGKLVFQDGYKLNLSSPIIAIQGELEMTASKTVDGTPNIKFTMIGNVDRSFTPIDVNTRACNGAVACNGGKKGIIVAGGKVNIHGIPNATPAWTRLYDVVGTSTIPTTILVSKSVIGKWGVGAQILITPHTRVWNQNQVRTIKSITLTGSHAAIELDMPILRPTTLIESPDFAVEVALLSRNIVFEGGSDSIDSHGGHFMIMNTPNVLQTIEGVDLRNFGQQGNLGRYPIHFHFCGDVAGSIVSKNTIRQSNQRCVVVHGTNRLRIEENVAYDTKGHCYMTEDGMEMNNQFLRNLGTQTGIPATLIPNLGPNGNETDGEPATFWITAPTNYFEGNVAAGSQHSGYWFEPKLRGVRASMYPKLDPMFSPLGSFKNNVAHSNSAGRLVCRFIFFIAHIFVTTHSNLEHSNIHYQF